MLTSIFRTHRASLSSWCSPWNQAPNTNCEPCWVLNTRLPMLDGREIFIQTLASGKIGPRLLRGQIDIHGHLPVRYLLLSMWIYGKLPGCLRNMLYILKSFRCYNVFVNLGIWIFNSEKTILCYIEYLEYWKLFYLIVGYSGK